MGLQQYSVVFTPSIDRYFDTFVANVMDARRFLVATIRGSHLVGIPTVLAQTTSRTDENAVFHVKTDIATYKVPFSDLAWAEELAARGAGRASDGIPALPEPCEGPLVRQKHEKFKILDSPSLLDQDLARYCVDPCAVIFLDIDKFKKLNTKFTESRIDDSVLKPFQQIIVDCVRGHGFAYSEGGDEITVFLVNTSLFAAVGFMQSLRKTIESTVFVLPDKKKHRLTISIGIAHTESTVVSQLKEKANFAERHAKELGGRNCVSICEARHLSVIKLDEKKAKRKSFAQFNTILKKLSLSEGKAI